MPTFPKGQSLRYLAFQRQCNTAQAALQRAERALHELQRRELDEMEEARIAREDDMEATETLLKASAGKIADAVAWCRSVAVLRGEQLDPDPRKWTRFARGVVCAAMTKETT